MSNRDDDTREALKELSGALCDAINGYFDPYTPKRAWEDETRMKMANLSKAYNRAYSLGALPPLAFGPAPIKEPHP